MPEIREVDDLDGGPGYPIITGRLPPRRDAAGGSRRRRAGHAGAAADAGLPQARRLRGGGGAGPAASRPAEPAGERHAPTGRRRPSRCRSRRRQPHPPRPRPRAARPRSPVADALAAAAAAVNVTRDGADRLRPASRALDGRELDDRRARARAARSAASPCTPTRQPDRGRAAATSRSRPRSPRSSELAAHPRVRVVGETGLDHFRVDADDAAGRAAQEGRSGGTSPWPSGWARRCRSTTGTRTTTCCASSPRRARRRHRVPLLLRRRGWPGCADRGWYLSFAGTVTFRNAATLREALRGVPLDRLLVETDAPYLTPAPYRGRPNAATWCRSRCAHGGGPGPRRRECLRRPRRDQRGAVRPLVTPDLRDFPIFVADLTYPIVTCAYTGHGRSQLGIRASVLVTGCLPITGGSRQPGSDHPESTAAGVVAPAGPRSRRSGTRPGALRRRARGERRLEHRARVPQRACRPAWRRGAVVLGAVVGGAAAYATR